MPTHYRTPSKMKGKSFFFSSSLTAMCEMITIQNPDLEEKKPSSRPPLAAPPRHTACSHTRRWLTTCKLTQKQAEKFFIFIWTSADWLVLCGIQTRENNRRRFMKEDGVICHTSISPPPFPRLRHTRVLLLLLSRFSHSSVAPDRA